MHNKKLADAQGLDETTREVIDSLHGYRRYLEVSSLLASTIEEEMSLYSKWFNNEQLLQKLWKFPQDINYIKVWKFPACSCPQMDNEDCYPYGNYIKVQNCHIHGWDE